MKRLSLLAFLVAFGVAASVPAGAEKKPRVLNVKPPALATDKSVAYDYDIVYVRAPRRGDDKQIAWTEVFAPLRAEPGSDLMLLHPDGTRGGPRRRRRRCHHRSVRLLRWRIGLLRPHPQRQEGPARRSSLRRVPTSSKSTSRARKIVQLTRQTFTPNTGVVAKGLRAPGVYNLAPCPLPGGKVMFTSNRNGFAPTKGYTPTVLQLFVMDDDGGNVEQIGHLNINSALHPTILKDGRVMFTSYESQGLRDLRTVGHLDHPPRRQQLGPARQRLRPLGRHAPSTS